jgi:HEAT repeat protein
MNISFLISRRSRTTAVLGFLGVLATFSLPARADRLPVGPVEELRQALRSDKDGLRTEAGLKFRESTLQKRLGAIQSLGDISQALLLSEWKDTSGANPEAGVIDARIRAQLADRFVAEVRRTLEKGDRISRAAAAGLVGDTATLARERNAESIAVQGAFEQLAKDLIRAIKDPESIVRLQAIRSLGNIQIQAAASTIEPLGSLLTNPSVDERRAAGEALVSQIRALSRVRIVFSPTLQSTTGSFAVSREVRLQVVEAVLRAAAKGLADPETGARKPITDPEVRRLSAEVLFLTAQVLSDSDLIVSVRLDFELPPEGRPLTESERKDIERTRIDVLRERKELKPLLTAFSDLVPKLAAAASDKDPIVREHVIRTLEEMGNARQKLLWRAATVPAFQPTNGGALPADGDKKDKAKPADDGDARLRDSEGIRYAGTETVQPLPPLRLPAGEDPLLEGLEKALRALALALNDPKATVRLAAVDALETLGDDAAPVAPQLAWALTDPDHFVRWAAARTLGRMSPEKAKSEKVVPYLIKMLDDPDLDLRLIAAQSLERYGPAAKDAVTALGKATGTGDPEIRRAAIRALVGVGTDAAPVIPDIGAALSNSDVRVRRTAAEALSRFGTLAKPAGPALRKAIEDTDAEVRRFAADALLNIK